MHTIYILFNTQTNNQAIAYNYGWNEIHSVTSFNIVIETLFTIYVLITIYGGGNNNRGKPICYHLHLRMGPY